MRRLSAAAIVIRLLIEACPACGLSGRVRRSLMETRLGRSAIDSVWPSDLAIPFRPNHAAVPRLVDSLGALADCQKSRRSTAAPASSGSEARNLSQGT